jgi:hypothetical protein
MNMINGSHQSCEYDHGQMSLLIEATKENGTKIDSLSTAISVVADQQKAVTKYLLIVVCVIALGSKLVEMANNIWGRGVITMPAQQQENK